MADGRPGGGAKEPMSDFEGGGDGASLPVRGPRVRDTTAAVEERRRLGGRGGVRFKVDAGPTAGPIRLNDTVPLMDGDDARRMAEGGASILCLDVPVGTEVGIDYVAWRTDVNFRGLKLVPPGVHFFYYSPVGKLGDMAPRTGCFLALGKGDVYVMKWETKVEDFVFEANMDAREVERYKAAVKRFEFDASLGPYPLRTYELWKNLARDVSDAVVDRISPIGGRVMSTASVIESSGITEPEVGKDADDAAAKAHTVDLLRTGTPKIFFSPILGVGSGARPSDITTYAMDTTHALRDLFYTKCEGNVLLLVGELQASFVLFLLGQSLDAFEQWKHIVDTCCRCEELISGAEEDDDGVLARAVAQVLAAVCPQIEEAPKEFFAGHSRQDNFLHNAIASLYSLVMSNAIAPRQVASVTQRLAALCTERFGWVFTAESESDSDGPVVVDMDAPMY